MYTINEQPNPLNSKKNNVITLNNLVGRFFILKGNYYDESKLINKYCWICSICKNGLEADGLIDHNGITSYHYRSEFILNLWYSLMFTKIVRLMTMTNS